MLQFKFPKVKLDQEPSMRERLVFIVTIVVIFILFSNSIWSPVLGKARKLRTEVKSFEMQIDAVHKLIEAAQMQMQKAKKTGATETAPLLDPAVQKMLERRVLNPTDEINSTADLLGSRNVARRVEVKNVAVGDRVDTLNYAMVPLTIELSGTYSDIQNYMRAIENLGRPMIVKTFEIGSGGGSQGDLNAKLDVALYIVKR